MYRLVLYVLIFLLSVAGIYGALGLLPFSPWWLAYSTALIFGVSWSFNQIFARVFKAPVNYESTWLTALILALIITPASALWDPIFIPLAFWASGWAMASKYILAWKKKHVFNPAAFGVAMTGVVLSLSASWWVGTLVMVPFVLFGGLLVVRKIRRFDLWWSFILSFLAGQLIFSLINGKNLLAVLNQSLFNAPIFFFSTIMLTEPLTTPPRKVLRIIYGILVGLLFLPNIHISVIYLTPELALILGNIFAFLVSSKDKLILELKEVRQLSHNVFEFIFHHDKRFAFLPGQYMEWTLAHEGADSRGLRRYFTIASAPQENLKLGVKFYNPSSTYKKKLLTLRPGDEVVATQLSGDFTLPKDPRKKLVFIAGGIGSTPFRSMVMHLLYKNEKRPITLLYQNRQGEEVVYDEIFEKAEEVLGLRYKKIFSALSSQTIKENVPKYLESTFYISGPETMVTNYKKLLLGMGVPRRQVKTDYFPGF